MARRLLKIINFNKKTAITNKTFITINLSNHDTFASHKVPGEVRVLHENQTSFRSKWKIRSKHCESFFKSCLIAFEELIWCGDELVEIDGQKYYIYPLVSVRKGYTGNDLL